MLEPNGYFVVGHVGGGRVGAESILMAGVHPVQGAGVRHVSVVALAGKICHALGARHSG